MPADASPRKEAPGAGCPAAAESSRNREIAFVSCVCESSRNKWPCLDTHSCNAATEVGRVGPPCRRPPTVVNDHVQLLTGERR